MHIKPTRRDWLRLSATESVRCHSMSTRVPNSHSVPLGLSTRQGVGLRPGGLGGWWVVGACCGSGIGVGVLMGIGVASRVGHMH